MAVSYDAWKKGYESLNDQEKQQYNDRLKSMGNDTYNQYMKQYQQAQQPQQTTQQSNFNNQNGTTGANRVKQQSIQQTANGDTNQNRAGVQKTVTPQEIQSSINDAQSKMQNQKVSPELDTSKFNQDPGKITVQEGTAQQTGRPDYQASSDARLNEMKGNLDHYFATSPRMFNDRETFNKVFEYNSRESEAQRQLLDSYWKRKEDMDKASQYTSGESIANGLKNSEITTDQLNLIKEYSPEAYKAWQEQQEEQIKLRIVNGIVPPMMEDIASQINDMINRLGIQAQDALDIEGIYNETMDRTGAWQTLEDANRTVRRIEEVNNKRASIMSRYAASTGGTVSDALAAARMQKALAPWDTEMEGLQYQYQDYANLYSQKTATATQAANVRALQAQENQRIWNQKTAALGFATDVMSYRTPEQQAQLDIQKQQALNDVNLLYTSKLNDLNRYNQYATAKLENQLQQELTDLSVEDEAQLKANLNNALSEYYKNYGDIIQRSQAQAVDDIIAYAKRNGISVAQALTENFIKPLQNKKEYKQKVASDYGMLVSQSISTINGRSVVMTTNPDGTISYRYIDDGSQIVDTYTIGDTDYVELANGEKMTAEEFNKRYGGKVKPYDMVDSKVFDTSPASHSYYTLRDFMDDPKNQVGKTGGQCAKFVNDYLEKIGVGRYFGTEDIKTREQWINSDSAKVGTIAIFDYNHYTDGKNYGHVGIVVDTDDNGFWILDSNGDLKNPGKINKRYVSYASASLKGFFDPSQPPRGTSTTDTTVGGLSNNQLTALAEDYINGTKSYSDIKSTYGDKVLNAVGLRASQLAESGYEKSKIITDPSKVLTAEQNLMSKFSSMNKGNQEALTQINKMQQALDTISADKRNNKKTLNAASQTIVTAFNKILDPTSVVRESEYSRTPEGQSYLERLQGKYEQLTKGGAGLTYDNLKAAVNLANEFALSYQENQNQLAQLIRNQAKTYGLNESNILPLDVIEQLDNKVYNVSTGPVSDQEKYWSGLYTQSNVSAQWDAYLDFILNG